MCLNRWGLEVRKQYSWYLVTVQQTLLDPVAVVCQYGRRHTTWQQTRVLPANSADEARTLAKKIVAAKLKRGYKRKLLLD